jgi:redox-sensitive bicupin YhaK (pirin superfamily)
MTQLTHELRNSDARGFADHGWLKSRHTFSFADYYDPAHMGFKSLRVINEDFIAAANGFGTHPHKDMEIITYVVRGALEHKDSMGTCAVIRPGDVQHMSAGTGVLHSEKNPSADEEAHILQIWIMPKRLGVKPAYGQKSFEQELNKNDITLVVSQDGRNGSIPINQDADMFVSRLKKEKAIEFTVRPGRGVWLQLIKGQIQVGSEKLKAGDALSLKESGTMKMTALVDSEFLIFDLI